MDFKAEPMEITLTFISLSELWREQHPTPQPGTGKMKSYGNTEVLPRTEAACWRCEELPILFLVVAVG